MWLHNEFYQFVDARFAIQWHTITKAIKDRRIIRYDILKVVIVVISCHTFSYNQNVYIYFFEYVTCLVPKLKVDSRIDTTVYILVGYPVRISTWRKKSKVLPLCIFSCKKLFNYPLTTFRKTRGPICFPL